MKSFVLFATFTILAGCSGNVRTDPEPSPMATPAPITADAGPPSAAALVGAWRMTSVDGMQDHSGNHDTTEDIELDFRADGTVTWRHNGACSDGAYVYADHRLQFSPDGFVVDTRIVPDAGLVQLTSTGMSIAYVAPTNYWGNFTRIAHLSACAVDQALVGVWDMTSVDGPQSRDADGHRATHDFLQLELRADGTVTQRRSGV
jgi:hypothetical protein